MHDSAGLLLRRVNLLVLAPGSGPCAENTAHSTGAEFFQTLVRHLAQAVGAHYAFVAEFVATYTGATCRRSDHHARSKKPMG